MSNRFLKLANKNLSNNFTGGQNMNNVQDLSAAIANKFSVTITSTANRSIMVALLPSYYKTLGIDFDTATGSATPHYHNKQALLDAGIKVDAIIDDAQFDLDNGIGDVTIYSSDPSQKIRDYLEHVKYYTRSISKILIHSANPAAYRGNIQLQVPNPFFQSAQMPMDMNQFFSLMQFQDNRIDIDLSGVNLAITPDLLFMIPIPANSTVTIDLFLN